MGAIKSNLKPKPNPHNPEEWEIDPKLKSVSVKINPNTKAELRVRGWCKYNPQDGTIDQTCPATANNAGKCLNKEVEIDPRTLSPQPKVDYYIGPVSARAASNSTIYGVLLYSLCLTNQSPTYSILEPAEGRPASAPPVKSTPLAKLLKSWSKRQ